MTEEEYIMVTNKTALSCAIDSLSQVMGGKEYGVDNVKRAEAFNILVDLRDELFDKIKIKE